MMEKNSIFQRIENGDLAMVLPGGKDGKEAVPLAAKLKGAMEMSQQNRLA